MNRGVHIRTYGCQMNKNDSDLILDLLTERGFAPAEDPEQADILIINTCSVREHAERRALGYLATRKQWRDKGDRVLAVVGCMAKRRWREIMTRYPFVDLILGPDDYRRIADDLEEALKQRTRIIRTDTRDELYAGVRRRSRAPVCDFVSITRGCSNYCSYCVVPMVRGSVRSRTPEDVLAEVRCLVAAGVRDITLLGQNVNEYRSGQTGFVDLLLRVVEVPESFRVRFLTSHPKDFDPRLIDAVQGHQRLCDWFHLPLQSGSDRILSLMNRQYTRDDYRRIVDKIRARLPDATLTTDLIVGFPSETDAEFRETLDCVDELGFNDAYTYRYSVREGTAAADLPDLPEPVIMARLKELIARQTAATRLTLDRLQGAEREILFERHIQDGTLGHTRGNTPVVVKGQRTLGEFCRVRIAEIDGKTPIGVILR